MTRIVSLRRSYFTPAYLFNTGAGAPLDGLFVDVSDTSTLFQDAAGTTPVTTAGDPVRLVLDKSGNGNHLTAPSDAARPVYQTDGTYHWLDFDGVDDEIATAAALPFSTSIFNCTAFRLDAYNSTFPNIFSNRGTSTGTGK
ncbi:MAG: hypothetical protein R3268_14440, partial [Acidiferrobacterales bacterium]|nr:hypothetical protein [Acidiferrobacterales bacterium]